MPKAAGAKSSKTKLMNGRIVSAKSKTGNPACSQAMSSWVRSRHGGPAVGAEVFKLLAKCRSMARQNKQAQLQQASGKLAPGRGTWQRSEQAQALQAQRVANRPATAPAPAPMKALGRGTPERMQQAQAIRHARSVDQPYEAYRMTSKGKREAALRRDSRIHRNAKNVGIIKDYLSQGGEVIVPNRIKPVRWTDPSHVIGVDKQGSIVGLSGGRAGQKMTLARGQDEATAKPARMDKAAQLRAKRAELQAQRAASAKPTPTPVAVKPSIRQQVAAHRSMKGDREQRLAKLADRARQISASTNYRLSRAYGGAPVGLKGRPEPSTRRDRGQVLKTLGARNQASMGRAINFDKAAALARMKPKPKPAAPTGNLRQQADAARAAKGSRKQRLEALISKAGGMERNAGRKLGSTREGGGLFGHGETVAPDVMKRRAANVLKASATAADRKARLQAAHDKITGAASKADAKPFSLGARGPSSSSLFASGGGKTSSLFDEMRGAGARDLRGQSNFLDSPAKPKKVAPARGTPDRAALAAKLRGVRKLTDRERRADKLGELDATRQQARATADKATAKPVTPEIEARVRKAFDAANANGNNFVKAADLRARLTDLDRPTVDAALRKLRLSREFTMDSHEGIHGPLSRSERRASVKEGGSTLSYVSRHPDYKPPAPPKPSGPTLREQADAHRAKKGPAYARAMDLLARNQRLYKKTRARAKAALKAKNLDRSKKNVDRTQHLVNRLDRLTKIKNNDINKSQSHRTGKPQRPDAYAPTKTANPSKLQAHADRNWAAAKALQAKGDQAGARGKFEQHDDLMRRAARLLERGGHKTAEAKAMVTKAKAALAPKPSATAKPASKASEWRTMVESARLKTSNVRDRRARALKRARSEQAQARRDPSSHTDHKPGTVTELQTSHIHFDPHRFQYKLGHASETGSVGSLSGVKKYDPNLGGVLQVWKDPANGKVFVVNGHNRLDLARKLKADKVAVRFIDAKSAEDARSIGALTNIAEGRGSSLDAAKFFRDTGHSRAEIEAKGIPLREKIATEGLALSGLDRPIFDRVVRGELTPARGAIIGGAGLTPAQQKSVISLMDRQPKSKPIKDAALEAYISNAKASSTAKKVTRDLFGTSEEDVSLGLHRANLAAHINDRLSREKRVFGTVAKSKNAADLKRGNNQIDTEASGKIADEANQNQAVFKQLRDRSGPVAKILNESAERIHNGEKAKVVYEDAYKQLPAAIQAMLRGR